MGLFGGGCQSILVEEFVRFLFPIFMGSERFRLIVLR